MRRSTATFSRVLLSLTLSLTVSLTLFSVPAVVGQVHADDEPGPIDAAEVKLGRPVDFQKDVLPILQAKCLACHSSSKKEGGFVLESAATIKKGGDSGPAVIVEKPDESLLALSAGRRGDPSAMPPLPNEVNAVPLTPDELGLLMLWIREGAKAGGSAAQAIEWQTLPKSIGAVYSLAMDAEERIVAAGRANRIHLYDLVRQRELTELVDPALSGVAHRDIISSLAFSPDGRWLASGGYRLVKLWQRTDPLVHRRPLESPVTRIAVSQAGQRLAVGLQDGRIRLWNGSGEGEGMVLIGGDAAVSGLSFMGDGTRLVTAVGSTLRIWNSSDGQQVSEIAVPSPIRTLAAHVQVATGHEDGLIRVWGADQLAKPSKGDESKDAGAKDEEPEGEEAKGDGKQEEGDKQGDGDSIVSPTVELKGHGKPVTALTWLNKDKRQLVSGSEDGTVRIWDVSAAKEIKQIAHGSPVTVVSVTADGAQLASAGPNGLVNVWDAKGKKLAEFKGDPRPAAALALRQADLKVAQSRKGIAEKAVTETDKDAKERDESLKKAREAVTAAEKTVGEVKPKVVEAEKKQQEATASLAEQPDDAGRKKAQTDAEAAFKKEQEALKKAEDAVVSAKRGVELSEASVVVVKAELGRVKQRRDVEVAGEKKAAEAVAAAEAVTKIAMPAATGLTFAPDGSWLAVADAAGHIVQWHVASKRSLDVIDVREGSGVTSLAMTSDGNVIVGTADGHVDTLRTEPTWKLAGVLGPPDPSGQDVTASIIEGRALAIDFSPEGTRLATGSGVPSRGGQLLLWDVAKHTVTTEFADAHSDTIYDVRFSRDGTQLATAAADKFAKMFDVATGEHVRSFEGHTGHVESVSWMADGSTLATGGSDNAIKVWTTATGEQTRTIASHKKPVSEVRFVGIEGKLVSVSGDKAVLMHTVSNGRNYRRLDGSPDYLHALVVNHDESRVIAAGEDGAIRVWDGTNGKLLATFE